MFYFGHCNGSNGFKSVEYSRTKEYACTCIYMFTSESLYFNIFKMSYSVQTMYTREHVVFVGTLNKHIYYIYTYTCNVHPWAAGCCAPCFQKVLRIPSCIESHITQSIPGTWKMLTPYVLSAGCILMGCSSVFGPLVCICINLNLNILDHNLKHIFAH